MPGTVHKIYIYITCLFADLPARCNTNIVLLWYSSIYSHINWGRVREIRRMGSTCYTNVISALNVTTLGNRTHVHRVLPTKLLIHTAWSTGGGYVLPFRWVADRLYFTENLTACYKVSLQWMKNSDDWLIVFNATFSNISVISWRPVLVLMVEEAGIPGENHRQWASNW